jgi:hypothetical protein
LAAEVRPDDDVTAIRQTRDLALDLVRAAAVIRICRVGGVDLRQGLYETGVVVMVSSLNGSFDPRAG